MPTDKSTLTKDQEELLKYLHRFADYAETCGKRIEGVTLSPGQVTKIIPILNKVRKHPRADYAIQFDMENMTFRGLVIRNFK